MFDKLRIWLMLRLAGNQSVVINTRIQRGRYFITKGDRTVFEKNVIESSSVKRVDDPLSREYDLYSKPIEDLLSAKLVQCDKEIKELKYKLDARNKWADSASYTINLLTMENRMVRDAYITEFSKLREADQSAQTKR